MAYIVWPNGRDPGKLWHQVLAPAAGVYCGKISPDGNLMCSRESGHEKTSTHAKDLHLSFAMVQGQMENIGEWFDGDKAPPSYCDRDDGPILMPTAQPQAPALTNPVPPPTVFDPPTLTSKDRTATFYGEVFELDLIPDATDEDYKNLPTWETLDKKVP